MKYNILKNSAIDKNLWDRQIDACFNAKVFAKSWFLDIVSPNWKACIIGDNEAFIPITDRLKFGVLPVWQQPMLCQQLGVFSLKKEANYLDILNILKKKYLKTKVHLNDGFEYPESISKRINYVLDLSPSYPELQKNYNKDARKNLNKVVDFTIQKEKINAQQMQETIAVYESQYGEKQAINKELTHTISTLMQTAASHDAAEAYQITDNLGNLLFKGILLKDKQRIYYSFAAPTDAGRDVNITHFFIDFIIKKYAQTVLLLDFEGSSIPSVAKFYAKWGSEIKPFGVLT